MYAEFSCILHAFLACCLQHVRLAHMLHLFAAFCTCSPSPEKTGCAAHAYGAGAPARPGGDHRRLPARREFLGTCARGDHLRRGFAWAYGAAAGGDPPCASCARGGRRFLPCRRRLSGRRDTCGKRVVALVLVVGILGLGFLSRTALQHTQHLLVSPF